jgi:hypothetical protein
MLWEVDEFGPRYSTIIEKYMPLIEQSRASKQLSYLPDLRQLACTKLAICNNAEYFAYNHIRTVSLLTAAFVIAENIKSEDINRSVEENLIPIYLCLKDEEAVCIRTNLAKVFTLFIDLAPNKIIRYLDARKNSRDITSTEHGVINAVFNNLYGLLQKNKIEMKNGKNLAIIRQYALSQRPEEDISL